MTVALILRIWSRSSPLVFAPELAETGSSVSAYISLWPDL